MIAADLPERVADAAAEASPFLAEIDLQQQLRAAFDGLRVVVCRDDDLPPNLPPVLGNSRCHLYFLDTGEHCVKLTRDAEAASGLVVGLLNADDD